MRTTLALCVHNCTKPALLNFPMKRSGKNWHARTSVFLNKCWNDKTPAHSIAGTAKTNRGAIQETQEPFPKEETD
jgi:hypothetical protein